MPRLPLVLPIACAISLAACGSSDPPDRGNAKTPPKGDHVWKSMTDQIDKAKAVKGQLQEASRSRMKEADLY